WSLQGGGAVELKELLDRTTENLADKAGSVGVLAVSGTDDALILGDLLVREGARLTRELVTGENIRDYQIVDAPAALFPYSDTIEPIPYEDLPAPEQRLLWRNRTILASSVMFGKRKQERGLEWHEWAYLIPERIREPLSITFAFVATHNHFVLDRGGKVFNRSAPVIKLPQGASEDDHLALLGLLNSSTACFWMQQVFQNKGEGGGARVDAGYAAMGTEAWKNSFEFDGTKLKQFPIPAGSA